MVKFEKLYLDEKCEKKIYKRVDPPFNFKEGDQEYLMKIVVNVKDINQHTNFDYSPFLKNGEDISILKETLKQIYESI